MAILKIKVSDEPRIIVSAVTHPFKVILNMEGSTDTLAGIIVNEFFIYENDEFTGFTKAVSLLLSNKINFSVEF